MCCLSTAYDDLASRQVIRENLWNRPGWDTCVANTGMSYTFKKPATSIRLREMFDTDH